MKSTTRFLFAALMCLMTVTVPVGKAQSPAPIIVQAASTTPQKSAAPAIPANVSSVPEAIKLLEQVKSSNQEILSKQAAALEQLDELQKAADQLKIFTRRSTG